MKTMKKCCCCLFVLAAFAACDTDEYVDSSQEPAPLTFNVPELMDTPFSVVNEKGVELDEEQTRAYFSESSTGWSYRWETGDRFYFYSMRNGSLYQKGVGTIRKTESSTKLSVTFPYPHREGDVIYAYFDNAGASASASPTAVSMTIPAEQSMVLGAEKYQELDGSVTYGDQFVVPARNAMPIIARPVAITYDMARGLTSFISSLSFPMVGSLTEFRVYTSDANVALGETIKSLTIRSADGTHIAGTFTHDLTTDDYLTVSGVTGSSTIVTNVEGTGYTVPQGSANYVAIQTSLAPGTYPIQIELLTDKNRYILNYGSMTYSRAIRKYFYLDLDATLIKPLTEQSDVFAATFETENCTVKRVSPTNYAEIKKGKSLTATILADSGYEFKEGDLRVFMGGEDITASAVTTSGGIRILKVTGDVQVIAKASPIVTITKYYFTKQLTYVALAEEISSVYEEGTPFTAKLVPLTDRCTITQVFVWMGDELITDEVYDPTTQTIYIPAVTGDIQLTAFGEKEPYLFDVTLTATHCTIEAPTSIYEGETFEAYLTPEDGYELTDVVVTMRGLDATDICYVQQGGLGYVALPRVNGNITVTAVATPVNSNSNN